MIAESLLSLSFQVVLQSRGTYRSTEEGQHVLRRAAVLRLLQALHLLGHRGCPLQVSGRDPVQLLSPAQRTGQGVNSTLSQSIIWHDGPSNEMAAL